MTATGKVCYAISTGEYSDYHVVAVFSSKEKADAVLYLFSEASIEEFSLDPEMPEESAGRLSFVCYSHLTDPKTRQLVPGIHAYQRNSENLFSQNQQVHRHGSHPELYNLHTYVWAEDKDHAIKIAAERFAHYQAIQAGIAC